MLLVVINSLFQNLHMIGLIFVTDFTSKTSIPGRNRYACKWDFFRVQSRASRRNFHKLLGGAHNGVGLTGSGFFCLAFVFVFFCVSVFVLQ